MFYLATLDGQRPGRWQRNTACFPFPGCHGRWHWQSRTGWLPGTLPVPAGVMSGESVQGQQHLMVPGIRPPEGPRLVVLWSQLAVTRETTSKRADLCLDVAHTGDDRLDS